MINFRSELTYEFNFFNHFGKSSQILIISQKDMHIVLKIKYSENKL